MFLREDGAAGTRYNGCLMNCAGSSNIQSCVRNCQEANLEDVYGCAGEYGPDLTDVIYLVERNGQTAQTEAGFTITDTDKLSVFFDYRDAECNFNNFSGDDNEFFNVGRVRVDFTGGAGGGRTFYLRPSESQQLGCSSWDDKRMLGFTFDGLTDGDYDFTVTLSDIRVPRGAIADFASLSDGEWADLMDGLVDDSPCVREGTPYMGSFSVSDYAGHDGTPGGLGVFPSDYYEVFETEINRFNIGKGFIDAYAADERYRYNLDEFDVSIIQGSLWTITGWDTFRDFTIDDLNRAIFSTTYNDRKTKFDPTDDLQSAAFWIDQPLSSGLFTFYGQAGWNIYPKGPAFDNDDQPFIRGDFADSAIYFPFETNPATSEYSGCYTDPYYWPDSYLKPSPLGLGRTSFEGMSHDEMAESISRYSGTSYWQCRIKCLRRVEALDNRCWDLNECIALSGCPDSLPSTSRQTLCDVGFEPLTIKVHVNVPEEFLTSEEYRTVFYEDDQDFIDPNAEAWTPPLIGLYAATNNGYRGVPGGFVPMEFDETGRPVTDYEIPLPYFPYLPGRYLIIDGATGGVRRRFTSASSVPTTSRMPWPVIRRTRFTKPIGATSFCGDTTGIARIWKVGRCPFSKATPSATSSTRTTRSSTSISGRSGFSGRTISFPDSSEKNKGFSESGPG
ncbi:MAG: hypothetical protein M5R36_16440 [Deltaproteobacteria bacterium]|nr:hypothetical protein [Deltaproteobacteria bacterium]